MAKLKLEDGMDPDLADELMEEFKDLNSGDRLVYKVTEDGEPHSIRVLPGNYGKNGKVFFRKQVQHWAPDPKGKSKFNLSFTCPKFQDKLDGHCDFCDAREEWKEKEEEYQRALQTSGDDDTSRKLERALKAVAAVTSALNYRQSYIVNVVPTDEKPLITKIFYSPKTVFEPIFKQYAQHTKVIDTDEGHDFNLTRTKVKNQVKYQVEPVLTPSPLADTDDEIERLLKGRRNLDKEIVFSTPADIKAACTLLVHQILQAAKKDSGAARRAPKPKPEEDLPPPSVSIDDIDDDDDIPMGDIPAVVLDEEDGDELAGGPDEAAADPEPAKQPAKQPDPTPDASSTLAELAALEADLDLD